MVETRRTTVGAGGSAGGRAKDTRRTTVAARGSAGDRAKDTRRTTVAARGSGGGIRPKDTMRAVAASVTTITASGRGRYKETYDEDTAVVAVIYHH